MILSVEDYVKVSRELGLQLGNVNICQEDIRHLTLKNESVQGIVTSPPYSIALDYIANDAHAFRALGYDLEKMRNEFVGVRGKGESRIELYNQDMIRSFSQMHRVLEKGRYCAIVIGDATYQGLKVKTIDFTIEQCEKLGFALVHNINKIIYGLYNVMQTDNTLVFRKDR
jgi:DNA modification methylase